VRSSAANLCGSGGISSICFDQPDMAFTPKVLAFTRVITTDQIGIPPGSGAPSTQVGQILDADIYSNPSDSLVSLSTPLALAPIRNPTTSNPSSLTNSATPSASAIPPSGAP
jgi:hypothetical protein